MVRRTNPYEVVLVHCRRTTMVIIVGFLYSVFAMHLKSYQRTELVAMKACWSKKELLDWFIFDVSELEEYLGQWLKCTLINHTDEPSLVLMKACWPALSRVHRNKAVLCKWSPWYFSFFKNVLLHLKANICIDKNVDLLNNRFESSNLQFELTA